ncbi:hypothetical protein F5X98DRAFT_242953 [Xylaria grammica]|nr:hypothetical protein F5X98DRAFT_242953 [Xylaria grammica]
MMRHTMHSGVAVLLSLLSLMVDTHTQAHTHIHNRPRRLFSCSFLSKVPWITQPEDCCYWCCHIPKVLFCLGKRKEKIFSPRKAAK